MLSSCVLSLFTARLVGITSEADITGPDASTIVPDYFTGSIGDLRVLGSKMS